MIRSKCFFKVSFWHFLALHTKEEEVWPDGTHPMLFKESDCVCMPSSWSVDPILFSDKSIIFVFF